MKNLTTTSAAVFTFDSKPIAACIVYHLNCLLRLTNPNNSNIAVVVIVLEDYLLKTLIFVYNTVRLSKLWMSQFFELLLGLSVELYTESAVSRRMRHHL